MRDPSRFPLILEQFRRIWEQSPDWRFCQVVVNVTGIAGDPFYHEDDQFLQELQNYHQGSDHGHPSE